MQEKRAEAVIHEKCIFSKLRFDIVNSLQDTEFKKTFLL